MEGSVRYRIISRRFCLNLKGGCPGAPSGNGVKKSPCDLAPWLRPYVSVGININQDVCV